MSSLSSLANPPLPLPASPPFGPRGVLLHRLRRSTLLSFLLYAHTV